MKKPFTDRKGRKLTIDGILWKWMVGKSGNVVAYCEDGRHIKAYADQVNGRDFERGQWKNWGRNGHTF